MLKHIARFRSLPILLAAAAASLGAAPTTQPFKVDPAYIAASRAFYSATGNLIELSDPAVRERVRPAVVKAFDAVRPLGEENRRRRIAFGSLKQPTTPAGEAEEVARLNVLNRAIVAAVGDPAMIATIDAQSKSTDAQIALLGKVEQGMAQLFVAPTPAEQERAIDALDADLKTAEPESRKADGSAIFGAMRGVATVMSDPVADHCSAMFAAYAPPSLAAMFAADRYSGKYVGKPVTFTGQTAEGVKIDTEQFKGKVLLVDFWASWCGPCKAELPRLKAVYDQYHSKGFEVIGVSNDYTREALVKYLAANPLPWPSVFDPQAAEADKWNSITRQYKIESIPRMFLIDKAGILRTTEARSQMETLVPKLLAENADASPAVSMNAQR